jgi:hypothetical protein
MSLCGRAGWRVSDSDHSDLQNGRGRANGPGRLGIVWLGGRGRGGGARRQTHQLAQAPATRIIMIGEAGARAPGRLGSADG